MQSCDSMPAASTPHCEPTIKAGELIRHINLSQYLNIKIHPVMGMASISDLSVLDEKYYEAKYVPHPFHESCIDPVVIETGFSNDHNDCTVDRIDDCFDPSDDIMISYSCLRKPYQPKMASSTEHIWLYVYFTNANPLRPNVLRFLCHAKAQG